MKRPIIHVTLPICATIVVAGAWWASAGDLNPPLGPIQPTNRVQLNEQSIALPFTISQSGSYVLTSNLTGTIAQNGITIDADNVTLDLNGFTLVGFPGSLRGIMVVQGRENIAVKNGVVSNWGFHGVDLSVAPNSRLDGLRVSDNGGDGIRVSSSGSSAITNCVARNNGCTGIFLGGGTVTNCTAVGNTNSGLVLNQSTATNCTAESNGFNGIEVTSGTVTNCTATSNDAAGIIAGSSNVYGCTARFNDIGISVGFRCLIRDNVCDNNTARGIVVTGNGSRIIGNICSDNGVDGIVILGGTRNHVEGNTITHSILSGAIVTSAGTIGNYIVKNSAGGATIYSIIAGNRYGAIVTPGAAFTGVDPWANIQY